jgi:glyoxylase-like metal-dependent hydrolase (beta-lactamase superfamily II)
MNLSQLSLHTGDNCDNFGLAEGDRPTWSPTVCSMPLTSLPSIERLTLAVVQALPEHHPEHATFEPFPVHAWLVRHPDGPILVDTGIGIGHPLVDEWYRPRITAIGDALDAVGADLRDVAAVVLSHLHFDHCGQQAAVSAPVYVQEAEHDAARAAGYTVPDWATIAPDRLRLVDGDEVIADGVQLLATPGHTPGHQSVLIEAGDDRVVLAAQCAFTAAELHRGIPAPSNLHDETWEGPARASLERVRSLAPVTCHLSHDPMVAVIDP